MRLRIRGRIHQCVHGNGSGFESSPRAKAQRCTVIGYQRCGTLGVSSLIPRDVDLN
jgi:hypothetical protein